MADQRVRSLLIERRCTLEAVVLLELQECPFCFRARDTVEGAIVEPNSVKLYLRPPDIVCLPIMPSERSADGDRRAK